MKIISKFKDYYDYLQGVYGTDEKIVLDRRVYTSIKNLYISDRSVLRFYIGGFIVEGYYLNGRFYYGKELERFAKVNVPYRSKWYKRFAHEGAPDKDHYWVMGSDGQRYVSILKEIEPDIRKINAKANEPILVQEDYFGGTKDASITLTVFPLGELTFLRNPILREFDMNDYILPHDLYMMVSNFISSQIQDKSDTKPTTTDKEKIVSHGFDLKKSFRHRK